MNKLCEFCGINEVKNEQRRFCSVSCATRWRIIHYGSVKTRVEKLKHPCEICGIPTTNLHFCSYRCNYDWMRNKTHEKIYGEKSESIKASIRSKLLNKTYEGRYGIEKANELKKANRERMLGNIWGFKKGHKPWTTGLTKEIDVRLARIGRLTSKRNIGLKKHITPHTEETKEKIRLKVQKYNRLPEVALRLSETTKKQWQDPEFVKKQMKSRGVKPNKTELKLEKVVIPFGFRYVGDGQLIIGGKCPDYWDGDHKLIEHYGDYYYKGQDPQDRIDYFAKFGYETLIIWEHELKDLNKLIERIENFISERT